MNDDTKNNRIKGLFSDTIAFTISNFASKILVFLLVPLYTAILTTSEYGIADLMTNTVNVLYPILTLSIMEATLRFAFEDGVSKDEVLSNSLFIVCVSITLLLLITPLVKRMDTDIGKYWFWFICTYSGFNFQQVISQYVKGIGKTRIFAFSGIIQTIAVVSTNIIGLVVLKLGLDAYLMSIILGYVSSVVFLCATVKIRLKIFPINVSLMKEMIKFSTPMIPAIISWWISTSADKYVIIAYFGLAVSGIYSVAYKIPSVLSMLSNIFTSAWTLSAIKSINDKDAIEYQTSIYKVYHAINVVLCSLLIVLSRFLGKILFSKDFFVAWKCVPLLLVAYLFSGLSGFMASSFRATKNTKGLVSSTLIGAIANIVLNFVVIKYYGIIGAAVTTLIGFAITFYIRLKDYVRIIGVRPNVLLDSMVYLLLIIQAAIMISEVELSVVLAFMLLLIIVILYRNIEKDILLRFYKMIIKLIKRK